MEDRSFVLVISERAAEASVQKIGKALLALDGKGISASRPIQAVLGDVLLGVRDNVLLKTPLEPADLESLFRTQLGRDFKLCAIQWL